MKIRNAFEAFWFLTEHPKFKYRSAKLVSDAELKAAVVAKGDRIRTVKDQMPWNKGVTYHLYEFAYCNESFPCNLDIFYTKVDETRRVNDDKAKNINVECWLEFGQIKQEVSDGILHEMNYHDTRLDCGGPTFDIALVKLAGRVRKYYGDFKAPKWMGQ
jgi:hypothetical protein